MISTILSGAIMAMAVAAAPVDQTRHVSQEACGGAPNCVVYMSDRGPKVGFVQGMGPGSAWYRDNVEAFDSYSSGYNVTMHKRDGGSTTTHLSMTTKKTNYGNADVVNTVGQSLYDNCQPYSCTIHTGYQVQTKYASDGTGHSTLTVYPDGQYADMDYFIQGIKQIMGSKIDSKSVPGPCNSKFCTSNVEEHTAARIFNINRYVNDNLQGFLNVEVVKTDNGSNDCQTVTSALSSIAGSVSGIGGGFFGLINQFACSVAGG